MKRLTLIRHAKSSWKNPELADFDRPLNKRGKSDLPIMAEKLFEATKELPIDHVICSESVRTTKTYKGLIDHDGFHNPKYLIGEITPDLYLADVGEIIRNIEAIKDVCDHLAIIGHNPGLTDLANHLQDHWDVFNIPTLGIISFSIRSELYTPDLFLTPKVDKEYHIEN